jgi:hydrogenase-4 component E
MHTLTDPILIVLILTNLMILGTSRLASCIRLVSAQGILLGLLPLALHGGLTVRLAVLAAGSVAIKGLVFPWLLSRAQREAGVSREIEPWIGYTPSMLAGAGGLAGALWLSSRLPLPAGMPSTLALPVALFTILVGLFLILSRNTALSQVLGYLVLENGIYAVGVGLALDEHLLVELGVLLDALVAVFVMGIIIFHISREFDHIDVDRLSTLKDWEQ